jgi:hypothetical protein
VNKPSISEIHIGSIPKLHNAKLHDFQPPFLTFDGSVIQRSVFLNCTLPCEADLFCGLAGRAPFPLSVERARRCPYFSIMKRVTSVAVLISEHENKYLVTIIREYCYYFRLHYSIFKLKVGV